ncbi:Uu.00g146750.m01.CDS01 [Anthostomella pinea]|uniref:Uu.00g146750.m01.CDS01 n=1 Tax=Anthostomella pinea TaxID=933095 RepID=A0AAI8YM09_9PEZI|nr:Uu.00g146750.m01.CDS01 [Anthostomella pinea]
MTDNYKRINALTNKKLQEDGYYVIKQTLPKDGYYSKAPEEMKQLIDKLGYQHAWIVVGQVKKFRDKLDFQAMMYDLKMYDPYYMGSKTYIGEKDWIAPKSSNLQYLGELDGQDVERVEDWIKEWKGDEDDEDNQHIDFSTDQNNCATFVDWMAEQFGF